MSEDKEITQNVFLTKEATIEMRIQTVNQIHNQFKKFKAFLESDDYVQDTSKMCAYFGMDCALSRCRTALGLNTKPDEVQGIAELVSELENRFYTRGYNSEGVEEGLPTGIEIAPKST